MSSAAQRVTNAQNAQRSTGPRTESGKQRSSQNATRHGLTGATVVLPGEESAYEEFAADLQASLELCGPAELELARTVVETSWRLRRAMANEANLFALAQYDPIPDTLAAVEDPARRSRLLQANTLRVHERVFRNLWQQEARLHRLLEKTRAALVELQFVRREREYAAARKQAAPSPAGFVFANCETRAAATEPNPREPELNTGSESDADQSLQNAG
ncbi:MAG: hypothetical protein M3Z09_10160 [Acidobacteriota bacterium]|nr:hypothetical protein [Acidobacteriota bacterium]